MACPVQEAASSIDEHDAVKVRKIWYSLIQCTGAARLVAQPGFALALPHIPTENVLVGRSLESARAQLFIFAEPI